MKFWEALPLAVEQGKKIKLSHWGEKDFIQWGPPGCFYEDTGTEYSACGSDIGADDWEVIEENPHEEGTGPWAAWWLEKDRVVTVHSPSNARWKVRRTTLGFLLARCIGIGIDDGGGWRDRIPTWMLAATDWRLVDED